MQPSRSARCFSTSDAALIAVLAATALAASVCTASPASAWTGRATWTTFLRAGPGLQYVVTDEIDRDAPLEVAACRDGWCETLYEGATGYVQAELVAQAGPELIQPQSAQPCFDGQIAGYGKGDKVTYCPRQPGGAAAPVGALPK